MFYEPVKLIVRVLPTFAVGCEINYWGLKGACRDQLGIASTTGDCI